MLFLTVCYILCVDLCDYSHCVLVDVPHYPVLSEMVVSLSAELRRCGRGGARKGGPRRRSVGEVGACPHS